MWLSRSVAGIFACVLCGLLIVGLGCDDPPTITLKAVDCPKDKIELSVTVSNKPHGDHTDVTVTVAVTCDTKPLPFPQLIIDWWGAYTLRLTADGNGEVVGVFGVDSDPTGREVTVTVEGSDGQRKVVVELVPEEEQEERQ